MLLSLVVPAISSPVFPCSVVSAVSSPVFPRSVVPGLVVSLFPCLEVPSLVVSALPSLTVSALDVLPLESMLPVMAMFFVCLGHTLPGLREQHPLQLPQKGQHLLQLPLSWRHPGLCSCVVVFIKTAKFRSVFHPTSLDLLYMLKYFTNISYFYRQNVIFKKWIS